jgi:polyisoprenoid-binding protein YceI
VRWIKHLPPFIASTAVAEEVSYRLDEAKSFLFVEVKPAPGLLSKASHPHVVRATKWSGTVVFDRQKPDACRVEIRIPVADLSVDEPEMRRRLGYAKPVSDGDRSRVKDNMLAEGQLSAAAFGSIRFDSVGCRAIDPGTIEVTGDLEIRGKKKRVSVPMKVQIAGPRIRAEGKLAVTHADFGFEPYSAGLGAIANDPALAIQIRVVGTSGP